MLKDKDGVQYYNYYCGSRIIINEKQKLSFYIPETISSFRCYNELNNHSVNITQEVLRFNRYITGVVDEIFDGPWRCTVLMASAQQKCCVLNFEVRYDMTLKVQTPEGIKMHSLVRGHLLGDVVHLETLKYKEGDLFEFECSLPGVKNNLKTGQLSWKGCEQNNTTCQSTPPVKMNSMKTSGLLEVEMNNNNFACVNTTASGLTSAIKLHLKLVDYVPLDFFVVIGHVFVDVNDTYSYGGKPGEKVTVMCKSREKGHSVIIRCCKSGKCDTCFDGILENKNTSAEYRFNLTDSWNGMYINCVYAETSSKGKTITFDVTESYKLMQLPQVNEVEEWQQQNKTQNTYQTNLKEQTQDGQHKMPEQHVPQTTQAQQKDQAQTTQTPDAIHVVVKGHEPVETTKDTYVYDIVSGEDLVLQCKGLVEHLPVDLLCCKSDSDDCSDCDNDGPTQDPDGYLQYKVQLRESSNSSHVRLRCVYIDMPDVGKSIVFKTHSTNSHNFSRKSAASVVVCVCVACFLLACAAVAALVRARRRRRRRACSPRPPQPLPVQSHLAPLYYTVDEPSDLYYSYTRPH